MFGKVAKSPRGAGGVVSPRSTKRSSRTLNDDDDNSTVYGHNAEEDEQTTHGIQPSQLSFMLRAESVFNSASTASSATQRKKQTHADDSPTSSFDAEEHEFYDEYQFRIAPHAVEDYRRHKLATAGSSDAKMQTYKAVVSRSLKGHRDKDAAELVCLGLPMQARREFWLLASGASTRMLTHHRYYRHLCALLKQGLQDKEAEHQINLDIGRTLGDNQLSDSEAYLKRIVRVLRLYTIHRREDGYAQAVNLFAASLMVQGMSDEECFWVLDHITTVLFPLNFDRVCLGQTADRLTVDYYCGKLFPDFKKLLEANSLEFSTLCTIELIGSLMCGKMPYESVYVVWDRMMYFGAWAFFDALFRIIAAIERSVAKLKVKNIETIKTCAVRFLNSIVDMPKLLASKLPGNQALEPAALNLRRAKQRRLLHKAMADKGSLATFSSTSSGGGEPDPTLMSHAAPSATASTNSSVPKKKQPQPPKQARRKTRDALSSASSSSSTKSNSLSTGSASEGDAVPGNMLKKLNLANVGLPNTDGLPLTPDLKRTASYNKKKQQQQQQHGSNLNTSRVADSAKKGDTSSMTLSDDEDE